MPRQGAQHWSPVSCMSAQHIQTAQTAQTPLARPRPPHARGSHPHRSPVWRAGLCKKTHRATTAAVPWCSEARHEGCGHQHGVLGEPSSQPVQVERNPDQSTQSSREADTSLHRQVGRQKARHAITKSAYGVQWSNQSAVYQGMYNRYVVLSLGSDLPSMRSVEECNVTYPPFWFVWGLESLKYRTQAKHLSVYRFCPKNSQKQCAHSRLNQTWRRARWENSTFYRFAELY